MADERVAYSSSSRRSEQLSGTKFFHRSYGLFSMIFQGFNNIPKLLLIRNKRGNCYVHPAECTQQGHRRLTVGAGVPFDSVNSAVNSQLFDY